MVIQNKEDIKIVVKEKLTKKAEELIDSMDCTGEEFNIDKIEDIMTWFNSETKQIVIKKVNETIALFDEK